MESVWDYPRPPRLEDVHDHLRVEFAGEVIASTRRGMRVLETSHPPVYYFPPEDVRMDLLDSAGEGSWCEWKGRARYYDIVVGDRRSSQAGWAYPSPTAAFRPIAGWVAFYAGRVDASFVGDEEARAQPGEFYGGWITSWVQGPFKGGPGTRGW